MKLTILALDQAATSGFSIWLANTDRGESTLCIHGLARGATERGHLIDTAQAYDAANRAPLHVVLEDHSKIPASKARGTPQLIGMGDARGRWLEQLDLHGHTKAHRHYVTPQTWRAAVLGPFYAKAKTDACKAAAVLHARALTGEELPHDAAEAVVIGQWAARALPAMLLAKRGAA